MALLAPIFDEISKGFMALISGIKYSLLSPKIRASYIRFGTRFAVITALGYFMISATLMSMIPFLLVFLMGPILGPIVFMVICYVAFVVLLILWFIGRFPASLFNNSFGILRPFFSINQIAFLLTSLLVPMGCDKFMLLGIDVIYKEKGLDTTRIQTEYTSPGFMTTLKLVVCNAIFTSLLKFTAGMLTPGGYRFWMDQAITSFLIGCQIVSVYNIRIRGTSWTNHISWCLCHSLRVIAFSLPLQLVCGNFGWIGTVVWLGLGYSAAASLVEELVYEVVAKEDSKVK
mmetsp:Transcript_19384/g.28515  ORF Transcript_19384/g.28515 Transcript_19384/m.28515 type:complete len:287 (-) Transcript_19384:160-1020(-)